MFDTGTKKATVETKFANGAPCNTAVSSYNSVADFVNEVRVIPPINMQTGSTSTNSGSCGSGTGSNTFSYDGQGRLTAITPNTGSATTYTAWDSSGRPTAGTIGGNIITVVYNDAARTQTQTQQGGVTTLTFDANGILTSSVLVQSGITTTTTFTTTATAIVCK
jgi:YD repeat-containing protein